MRALHLVAPLLTGLAACSADDYLIVTVDAVPAVRDPATLSVALSNGGTTRMDSLSLRDQAFPVTFSVTAPGRAGELAIAIEALDAAGLVVGRGTATTTLDAASATIALDSTDFVVNTEFAGDQFPADDFEAIGFQVAALADGTWTAVFRDACMANACNIFARRFDRQGRPLQSALSASSNAFVLSSIPTLSSSTPAVAAAGTTTLAVWDYYDVQAMVQGIACRALDPMGRATDQGLVATDSADVVSLTAMANGNFVASWNASPNTDELIRAVIIRPDCTAAGAVQTVSAAGGFPHRAAVASSGDRVLFTWILGGDVHARLASLDGTFASPDEVLVAHTATEQVEHARIAAVPGGGFALAARWAQSSLVSGPGRIELFQVTAAGKLAGAPMLVTDRTATDVENREAFSLASRPDGTLLVAWHTCGVLGDDSLCGVFGRIARATGEPVGDAFAIPTTTAGDQRRPSVVGLAEAFVAIWSDGSARPPDTAGASVRARVVDR